MTHVFSGDIMNYKPCQIPLKYRCLIEKVTTQNPHMFGCNFMMCELARSLRRCKGFNKTSTKFEAMCFVSSIQPGDRLRKLSFLFVKHSHWDLSHATLILHHHTFILTIQSSLILSALWLSYVEAQGVNWAGESNLGESRHYGKCSSLPLH